MKYTDAWSRALQPVQAKQSMYEAKKQRPVRDSKKKKEKRKKDKMDATLSWKPPLNNPGFLIMKQTFLYKHDGIAFCGNLATCYSLCDTNILHYVLRRFRYWTPVE